MTALAAWLAAALALAREWVWVLLPTTAVIGLILALCDLHVWHLSTPTTARQTNPVWWRTVGPSPAMFLWGLDIGLGFTTVRVTSLYWMAALLTIVIGSPVAGALIFVLYGSGLVMNLVLGAFTFERERSGVHANVRALSLFDPTRITLAAFLISSCVALICVSWALRA